MLKDSKTGKQGAADAIITVGAKNEAAYENTRFIGLTKNKLHIEGRPKSPKSELVLDGPAGRFIERKPE
jgi:replicative DNA helicase